MIGMPGSFTDFLASDQTRGARAGGEMQFCSCTGTGKHRLTAEAIDSNTVELSRAVRACRNNRKI